MTNMVVETASGALRGTEDAGVKVFRGVPYAAPPVGHLRFMPPEPVPHWQGVRDARHHGPIAPQLPTTVIHAMGDVTAPQGEDCLTLTIWTPRADGARRPVLVWLHGGSFTSGAASLDWYNGANLARIGDIVVVGVNYRLGALGFLCHEGIAGGNMGLLDQQTAFSWIAGNIEFFGGDPTRITLAGQSAGADAIAWHAGRKPRRAVFRRAILQSGFFHLPQSSPADMEPTSAVFLHYLGIDPDSGDALSRLQAARTDDVLAAQAAALAEGGRLGGAREAFRPVHDAAEITRPPVEAIAASLADADVMLGITADEMHFFVGRPGLPDFDEAFVADRLRAETGLADPLAHYRPRFPGSSLRDLYCAVMSEIGLPPVTQALSDALSGNGTPAFGYLVDWAPQASRYRACHCIELPFLFGNFEQWGGAGMLDGGNIEEMTALSTVMQRAWISFVRDGVPEPDPQIPWLRYDTETRNVLRLGRNIRLGRSYLA